MPKSRVNSPNRGTRRSTRTSLPNHDAINSTFRKDIGKRATRCIKWCFFFLNHVQLISSPSPQMALFSFFTSVCLLSVLVRAGIPFSPRFYLCVREIDTVFQLSVCSRFYWQFGRNFSIVLWKNCSSDSDYVPSVINFALRYSSGFVYF